LTGIRSAKSIMASGRVERRIQRPDTWKLRPAVQQDQKLLPTRSRPHMADSAEKVTDSLLRLFFDKQSGMKLRLWRQGGTALLAIGLVAAPSAKPFRHLGRRNRPEDFINTIGAKWTVEATALRRTADLGYKASAEYLNRPFREPPSRTLKLTNGRQLSRSTCSRPRQLYKTTLRLPVFVD
jgi:hypothetical protein